MKDIKSNGVMDVGQLANHFMRHSPGFHGDLDIPDIDNKHTGVIREAYRQIKNDGSLNLRSFRNWSGQSDLGVPAQISLRAVKAQGLARVLFRYGYRKIFKAKEDRFLLAAILDDIEANKQLGAESLLIENPVHLTPGVGDLYDVSGTTVNLRWLRYIYLLKKIIDLSVLAEGGVWVDVGSYYGGLQGLVRKYQPNARIVMVDFHHQLCRSFIYLSTLFPDAKHILPDQISGYACLAEAPEGSIMYIPTSEYNTIKDQYVDLVTNFFSLGEMRREIFNSYMASRLFTESRITYLVNRFVSAPYFEKTYDSDVSILDYVAPRRKMDYFDVFPIHHYMLVRRDVFGRNGYRNVSSPYFEMITSK